MTTKRTATTDLVSRLSSPAKQSEHIEQVSDGRTSRFWFKVPKSQKLDRAQRKAALFKEREAPVNKHIIDMADAYKRDLGSISQSYIDRVRAYMLDTIAPLSIAADIGMSEAVEVLQESTGQPVDKTLIRLFEVMARRGLELKLSRFLADYLSLNPSDADSLLESVTPKMPQQIMFPIPEPEPPEGTHGRRTRKNRKQVLPRPDAEDEDSPKQEDGGVKRKRTYRGRTRRPV